MALPAAVVGGPLQDGPAVLQRAGDVGTEVEGQAAVVRAGGVEPVLDDQPARPTVQPDAAVVDGRGTEAPVAVVGGPPLGHRAVIQPGRLLQLAPGLRVHR